jgi:hypothetical protein
MLSIYAGICGGVFSWAMINVAWPRPSAMIGVCLLFFANILLVRLLVSL